VIDGTRNRYLGERTKKTLSEKKEREIKQRADKERLRFRFEGPYAAILKVPYEQEQVDELLERPQLVRISIEGKNKQGSIEHLDFSSWSSLEHLECLVLHSLSEKSFAHLFAHTQNVCILYCRSDTPVPLLRDLSLLPNLQIFELFGSQIVGVDDLSQLVDCKSLESIDLNGTFEDLDGGLDLSFVRTLKELQKLRVYHPLDTTSEDREDWYLWKCGPLDLGPLSSCFKLEKLIIHGLDVGNIGTIHLNPLSSCRSLEHVQLTANSITELDLSPLSECPISLLDLRANGLRAVDLSPS
jgi:hypothetical protein